MLKGINNFAGTEKEVTVYGSQKTDGRIPVSELKVIAAAVKAADIEKEADRFDAAEKNCGLKMNNGGKTVTAENYEIIKDTHSEDSCENNVNAGRASVTAEGRGEYSGSAKISFTILPETGEKKVAVSDAVYAKAFPGSDRNESGRKGV